ncbi:MAG: alpha/beta hydrolase [Cycloclasticus sp.]|nr:MAG: alpha/beta hydrolase [Cycloclasticus sp.]
MFVNKTIVGGYKYLITSLLLLLMYGCVNVPTQQQRINIADALAEQNGWNKSSVKGDYFNLTSYTGLATKSDLLTVYIEGDGFAWLTRSRPSMDPTPLNPVGLKLALAQQRGQAAYLARPCQFVLESRSKNCSNQYWTNKRFSNEVINDFNIALTLLKKQFSAITLRLVGYSGGATVALLVAARRGDIESVVTVAGNLDHGAWAEFHNLTPLYGSLNPIDYSVQLENIKQVHFVGDQDTVSPLILAKQFAQQFSSNVDIEVVVVKNQDHGCCWEKIWPGLIGQLN